MGRQSIIDETTTIDDANLSKIQGLSEIAMQELNSFDTVVESDVAEKYEKIKKEMLSETQTHAETETTPAKFERVENEFFPTINLKHEEQETPEKVISINLRGKLIIGVFTTIVALLCILLIYNAVLINRYKAEIGADSQIVSELEVENASLEGMLNDVISGVSPEGLGMSEGVAESIPLIERTPDPKVTAETNWFDAICNFFSELFGG